MSFSSINIQGNIISSEILDKIRSEEKYKFQTPEAFGLARSASLRDEIGMAWSIMRTHWQAYKKRLETLPQGDSGTSLTREKLIIPLLIELGYQMGLQRSQLINGKSYTISHSATNKDDFPIHIMGYNDNLDKRRDTGSQKVSPHALVQEYLNNTEHLFALVTNGRQLRLLRDATRLVRMSYLEFDLERMFEEELYADFSLLFRVLHASRMPDKIDAGAESIIEFYHQESMASGTRIRTKLSEAVEDSIKTLANGFLSHPKNEELIALIENNQLNANTFYTHQLRLIYRILFLIVLEERKLIYPENLSEEEQRFREIYYKYYSIERLRKLTENRVYVDGDKYDLWESLKTTFLLFEQQEYGNKIGIKPLGSGLFAPAALGTLKEQFLSNANLIEVLKRLTTFVNDQKQLVRVNYSDLDVEEFGSVYEGLLEYAPVIEKIGLEYHFAFVKGDERSSSGSHYTPEELVKPLIKHSLEYIIADKLKKANPEEALLSITVCDVACGSGHILLSAARKIAAELASLREGAEQPSPAYYRGAIRDVIKNCIYGVDLNPLAVELCKVALWLEAHEPGQPMNFLDHHIKCGNAIVGLAHFEELENGIASEAFKTLPGDNKEIAAAFKKRNTLERKTKEQLSTYDVAKVDDDLKGLQKEFTSFSQLPENTPEQIAQKDKAYQDLTQGKKWFRLKQIADLQVAQFFIPKTEAHKEKLTTHSQYMSCLKTEAQILDRGTALATSLDKRFFHWFLEFPQVFQNGGFDCILGNPPYLGGKKISGAYGGDFLNFIHYEYQGVGGQSDLVTYFLRRINEIINNRGFLGLITTNSISEGDTRSGGLDIICSQNAEIVFAIKSTPWVGEANLNVSLLSITKQLNCFKKYLNGKVVENISPLFSEDNDFKFPNPLLQNQDLMFRGVDFGGTGFILDEEEAKFLLKDEKNSNVISNLLNADDLLNIPDCKPKRQIINFRDFELSKAKLFTNVMKIVLERVKPERESKNDKAAATKWWIYKRNKADLYKKMENLDTCIVIPFTSKFLIAEFTNTNYVISNALNIISNDQIEFLGLIQSTIHEEWARKYGSSLETRMRYTPTDVFETFPLPNDIKLIRKVSEDYHSNRKAILNNQKIGLTTLYNKMHTTESEFNSIRDFQNELDYKVIEAYGWQDISLRHDFYEVDYLPENDRVRYTIHPEARKEVLKRLLELNHKIHEEEVAAGLWDKKKEKVVKEKAKVQKQKTNQVSIFDTSNDTIMKEFTNTDGIYKIADVARIINKPIERVRRWFNKLAEIDYEGLDNSVKTDIDNRRISFHGLIELVVIGELIDNDFNIRAIFKARQDLSDKTGKPFPFATNNVNQKLKVSGSDITWDFEDGNITLNGKNQFNLDIVREFFRDIEFDTSGIAQRITPSKGLKRIEITPKVGGGKPSIISQKGVNVETILHFYSGPESIEEIIEDYEISKEDIEAVLAYQS